MRGEGGGGSVAAFLLLPFQTLTTTLKNSPHPKARQNVSSRVFSFQAKHSSVFLLCAVQSARLSIIRGTKLASFYHSRYTECVFLSRGVHLQGADLDFGELGFGRGKQGPGCVAYPLLPSWAKFRLSIVRGKKCASLYHLRYEARVFSSHTVEGVRLSIARGPPAGRGS